MQSTSGFTAVTPTVASSAAAARPGPLAYLAFAAICFFWGTSFAAIRMAIETIPTLLVTSMRFLSAGLLMLVVARVTGARFPRGARAWREQIVAGVLMTAIGNTLVVYAEHDLPSGLAALLTATIPIWMAVMESAFSMDTLTPRKIAGLVLGFGGVGLLVAPEIRRPDLSWPFFIGVAALQLNAISWNAGSLLSRRSRDGSDPIGRAVVQILSGGTLLTIVSLVAGQAPAWSTFSIRSIAAVAYLSVFGSVVSFTAYSYALTRLSAVKVASYAYVNPAVAVILGALLFREPVTLRIVAAMLLILAGVLTIQLSATRLIRLVTREHRRPDLAGSRAS